MLRTIHPVSRTEVVRSFLRPEKGAVRSKHPSDFPVNAYEFFLNLAAHEPEVRRLRCNLTRFAPRIGCRLPDPHTMTTLRQLEANRQNAQKPTGPKTPEGKAGSPVCHESNPWGVWSVHGDQDALGAIPSSFFSSSVAVETR